MHDRLTKTIDRLTKTGDKAAARDRLAAAMGALTLEEIETLLSRQLPSERKARFDGDQITQQLSEFLSDREQSRKDIRLYAHGVGGSISGLGLGAIGRKLAEYNGPQRGVATLENYVRRSDWLAHLDPKSDDIEAELIAVFREKGLIEVS